MAEVKVMWKPTERIDAYTREQMQEHGYCPVCGKIGLEPHNKFVHQTPQPGNPFPYGTGEFARAAVSRLPN